MRPMRADPIRAVRFDDGRLIALDQTRLPWEEVELELRTAEQVAAAIARLQIRGAPLIGVAAAYGLSLAAAADPSERSLALARATLAGARPTAVNLAHALDRVARAALAVDAGQRAATALAAARALEAEEEQASDAIAARGADLLAGARRLLTHCNTGALAAPGRGTALAVVAEKAARGELELVVATESRPLLQGSRLTVYELARLGIRHQLIVDSAASGLIAAGEVDAVIVGCDRVAANGDVANKVGTYPLALAARAAGIEMVVAAPTSTIDPATPSGAQIVIEERDASEVRAVCGRELTLPGTPCRNPAFDVTPAELISALVTERGVAHPPTQQTIAQLLGS
jgi:methylthioribose-1-phosphate isomerase